MRRQQNPSFKRFARLHFWAVFFSFSAYVAFGFALGPDFFKRDILKRISALADDIITVTAVVLGPPATPIITVTPVCVSGAPRILLDWADDAATDTWDVERDSLPLSTGVTVSQYADTAVITNTSYTYVISAYGPMAPGSAVSAPVSVMALGCTNTLPAATVTIETLGGQSVASDRTGIVLDRTRPQVTGTTNIPGALVTITLTHPSIQANTVANVNGYFSWIPPVGLANDTHVLSVTITDPDDPSRTATDSFSFRTRDGDANDGNESSTGTAATGSDEGASSGTPAVPETSIDFSVSVNHGAQFVFQGDTLNIAIASAYQSFPEGTSFSVFILDATGKEVRGLGAPVDGSGQSTLLLERKAPLSIEPGTYRIRIDASYSGRIVSREVVLPIRSWPLIRFGENAEVTYFEVASFFGTIFFLLLSLFLFLLLLFVREYWLYLHHIRHVTERNFGKMGFISSRKGVAKS
jgi:hypothetical protein